MARIAVSGAAGRMGKAILAASRESGETVVSCAVEQPDSIHIGEDAGVVSGIGPIGVTISASPDPAAFDVLIEFTNPRATVEHATQCAAHGKAMVIGTTGIDADGMSAIAAAAARVPMVMAPNMSVGVNLCFRLIELAAEAYGDSVDVEIIEAHHRHKVDAPSGTALRMGKVVARALGRDLGTDGVFARHGATGPRPKGAIGFATVRAGDIVGEHTVLFCGEGERIEIVHRATSRMTFAHGALRAARWVRGQPPGLYGMDHVLGLD